MILVGGWVFLMSEVPLYAHTHDCVLAIRAHSETHDFADAHYRSDGSRAVVGCAFAFFLLMPRNPGLPTFQITNHPLTPPRVPASALSPNIALEIHHRACILNTCARGESCEA